MYTLLCNIKRKLVSKEVERRTKKDSKKKFRVFGKKKEGNKKKERQNTDTLLTF